MLINGKEKLERMRDGRAIYIGAERVDDVTRHPAFRNGAQTIAGLYDLKADPAKRDLFTFEEGGERYGLPWLRCRNRDDLARRMRAMKAIADATYGLIGRSPDHVAGLVTGLAMKPALLDGLTPRLRRQPPRYYELARKNDLYLSFAVTPPSGIRSPRNLHRRGARRPDPAGGRRGRQRRHHLGHEDDGDRRGVRRRGLGRQSHRRSTTSARARASPARCRTTRPASRSGRASPMSATPATRPTIR